MSFKRFGRMALPLALVTALFVVAACGGAADETPAPTAAPAQPAATTAPAAAPRPGGDDRPLDARARGDDGAGDARANYRAG